MKKFNGRNSFLKFPIYAGGFFLLLLAFYGLKYMAPKKYCPESKVKITKSIVYNTGIQCVNTTNGLFQFLGRKKNVSWREFNTQPFDKQAGIIIEDHKKPIYWNNNKIPASRLSSMKEGKVSVIFFGNRIYVGEKTTRKGITAGVFFQLSKKQLPYGVKIENHPLLEKNEYFLPEWNITLKIPPNVLPPKILSLLFFLFVALILFFVLLILQLYKKLLHHVSASYSHLAFLLFLITLLIIRGVQYHFGFPGILKGSYWVSGQITHLPTLKTPGDLFISFLLFCIGLVTLLQYFRSVQTRWKKHILLKFILLQLVFFSIPVALYSITEGILQNGGIVLFPENIYFNTGGVVRLLIMIVINILLYLWADGFLYFYKRKGISFSQHIVFLTLIGIVLWAAGGNTKMVVVFTYVLLSALSFIFWFIRREKKPYFHSILIIFLLSFSAGYFLNNNEQENRNERQRFTANLLTQKQDPFLQYLIRGQANTILSDTNIIHIIKSNKENREQLIAQYLNKRYFRGMLSSYSKQVTLCEPEQQLEIQPDNKVVGCDAFFKQLKGKTVDSLARYELSLVNNTSESIYYLARFHYSNLPDRKDGINLYVEFYTNIIPKGLGYPELLEDGRTKGLHLSGYSFAFYKQGKLEYKFGDFLYPVDISDFRNMPERRFFNKAGYTHYMLKDRNNEILFVSRIQQTVSGWLLPFSLLFIASGLLLLLFIFFKYGRQIPETFSRSFSTRLQLTIFSSMLVVFFFLTALILYYFNANNQKINSNNLKEKTHSVLIELQNKLSQNEGATLQNKQAIQSYLQKLSTVFFSDINLYNNAGELIVSSRPEIFSRGLQSSLINPKAYMAINKAHKLFYLGKEEIQHIKFYSSYAPFILSNGTVAGIINLPYFARQSEHQYTYFQMLANLINLFVITGWLGMLLMVYLSRLLMRPLNILQRKITSVSIETQNEKIAWNRKDEIGKLIEAYNNMVEKLEESAQLLKYSAREKAWREMAQQIAHEIRNPLTPMKLNVQYLQKVYRAKDPSFDEKFKSVSQSLIGQIDTMNEVVNMFSDFSKIKISAGNRANLLEALESTAVLFRKSYKIKITIETEKTNINVKASLQDLLRIFNNLLKNAVQSMDNIPEKKIRIQVFHHENYVEVHLTDNGKGISEEDQRHIFQPYFTTKSKGTGLGLAIVKNLMTEMGGEILFVSEKRIGTTFILRFPVQPDNSHNLTE